MKRSSDFVRGAAYCCLLAPAFAAIVGTVYRFPIPFREEYGSGASILFAALFAAIFYEFLGGGAILAILGGVAGLIAGRIAGEDHRRARLLTAILAAVPALAAVIVLSVLDKIIGPW